MKQGRIAAYVWPILGCGLVLFVMGIVLYENVQRDKIIVPRETEMVESSEKEAKKAETSVEVFETTEEISSGEKEAEPMKEDTTTEEKKSPTEETNESKKPEEETTTDEKTKQADGKNEPQEIKEKGESVETGAKKNPFLEDTESVIREEKAEKYVEECEDGPGHGIHF